jgi:uncharacterized protein (DUF58 family)
MQPLSCEREPVPGVAAAGDQRAPEPEPKLVEPDYPGAFRYLAARNRKRALTVLFTDVIDRFASEALVANVASLRPRHLPVAVTLRNPELDHLATLRPTTPRDAFRKGIEIAAQVGNAHAQSEMEETLAGLE